MACLSPISIFNPSKVLSLDGGTPFKLSVPCGRCPACNDSKHWEYYFRAFYEGKKTFDNGGFIQAVTLTYRDSCLPHLSDFIDSIPKGSSLDFPCFSPKDIRGFLVRVREHFTRYGYDIKGNLNYFICSEYGTAAGKTHRPHYHCLFYVNFPIDALEFSKVIGDCWPFGITDTYPHRPKRYIFHYTFGYKYTFDENALQLKSLYVAKYVLKSSSFDKEIRSRIEQVISMETCLLGQELDVYMRSPAGKSRFSSLYRAVTQFHRQGNGFGADLLKYNNLDDIFATGMISISDRGTVIRHIPLPMYYRRRLFYNLTKDFRGERVWRINELGVRYMVHRSLDSITHLANHFKDWFANLHLYLPPVTELFTDSDRAAFYSRLSSFVVETLGDRSWKDFATYIALYRGRIKSTDQINREFFATCRVDELDTWLLSMFQHGEDTPNSCYSYITSKDYNEYSKRFLSPHWLAPTLSFSQQMALLKDVRNVSLNTFLKYYVINDSSAPEFNGFDLLYSLYCQTCQFKVDYKSSAREFLDYLFEKFENKNNHL